MCQNKINQRYKNSTLSYIQQASNIDSAISRYFIKIKSLKQIFKKQDQKNSKNNLQMKFLKTLNFYLQKIHNHLMIVNIQMSLTQQIDDQKINHPDFSDNNPKEPVVSQFLTKYQKAIKEHVDSIQTNQKINNISGISYYPEQFRKQMEFKVKRTSISKEVVVLTARWGFFQMDIKILNFVDSSKTHSKRSLFCYSNRALYKIQYNDSEFVVKCIEIKNYRTRQQAIKEWFLLKVCSALKVGPHVGEYLGFDLLMHQSCIEFAMQLCEEIHQENFRVRQAYQNLELIHRLHIVHQDIKPQNIMFSPKFNKVVFIDFGLSTMVEEQLGWKTLTNFVGSWNFCSEQMSSCFNKADSLFVDLYYNDLHCLISSIKMITKFEKCSDNKLIQLDALQRSEQKISQNTNEFELYLIKSLLFSIPNSLQELYRLKQFLKQTVYLSEVLSFLKELPPNKKLKQLFFRHISERESQTILYGEIKFVYRNNNQHNSCVVFEPDQQKIDKFRMFYLNLDLQLDMHKNREKKVKSLKDLVLSRELISKTSYFEYVTAYLQYISFLDNICECLPSQREEAAIIYVSLFIRENQGSLKGLKLIGKTIEHIIQMYLFQNYAYQISSDHIASLFLSLYDFMSLLDCGTTSEYFQWLNGMFQHSKMQPIHTYLLLFRVVESLDFYHKNTKKRNGESRFDFLVKLQIWVESQRKRFIGKFRVQKLGSKEFCIYEIDFTFNKKRKICLSDVILKDCDLTYIYYDQNLHIKIAKIQYFENALQKMIEIKINNVYPKISYCFSLLLHNYLSTQNAQLYNGVIKIIENNIKDPIIYQSFNFDFHQRIFIPFLKEKDRVKKDQRIAQISQFLLNMEQPYLDENKVILNNFFNNLLFRNVNMISSSNQIRELLPHKDTLRSLVKVLFSYFLRNLTNQKTLHLCLKINEIYSFLAFSLIVVPQQVNDFKNLLLDSLKSERKCLKCRRICQIDIKVSQLQVCVITIGSSKEMKTYINKQLVQQKLDQLSQMINSKKQLVKLNYSSLRKQRQY